MLDILVLLIVVIIDLAYLLILISINLPSGKPEVKKLPKISVIVAAKDGKTVKKTLKMLKKIKGLDLEIIVAASDPVTLRIVKKYAKAVKDLGIGKGAALNLAVEKASGEILYFLDEDMVVGKDTIQKVCSALSGHEVAVGYNVSGNADSTTAKVARLYLAMLTKMQSGIYSLIGTTFVAGRNFAIYRKTLNKAGNFRNVLTEDLDLSFRLFARRKKVRFVDAGARDQAPSRLAWYIKQQQRWNVGAGQALIAWEKKFRYNDIFLLLFIALMALIPLAAMISFILAVALQSYIFASAFFLCFLICLSSAAWLGKKDVLMLPLTFPILIIVQSFAIVYSAVSKPKGWYRTPKN